MGYQCMRNGSIVRKGGDFTGRRQGWKRAIVQNSSRNSVLENHIMSEMNWSHLPAR